MTHTSRPPSGNARAAWDYFSRKYPGRVREVYYSPNCRGVRAWICELTVVDADMRHCDTYDDWWVKTISVGHLQREIRASN